VAASVRRLEAALERIARGVGAQGEGTPRPLVTPGSCAVGVQGVVQEPGVARGVEDSIPLPPPPTPSPFQAHQREPALSSGHRRASGAAVGAAGGAAVGAAAGGGGGPFRLSGGAAPNASQVPAAAPASCVELMPQRASAGEAAGAPEGGGLSAIPTSMSWVRGYRRERERMGNERVSVCVCDV
jgi:hypothetical protein